MHAEWGGGGRAWTWLRGRLPSAANTLRRGARALCFGVVVLTPLTPAGEQTKSVGDVTVLVRTPWPDLLHHGYFPLTIELANAAREDEKLNLELRSGFYRQTRAPLEVDLKPGEQRTIEIFLPVDPFNASQFSLTMRAQGESSWFNGIGPGKAPDPNVSTILFASKHPPADAGATARWASALSTEASPRHAPIQSQPHRFGGLGYVTTGGKRTAVDVRAVHAVLTRNLPSRPEPYSSIEAVVLDTTEAVPNEAQFTALVEWARTGGRLVLIGSKAEQLARGRPDLAAWMEERFRVGLAEGLTTYACGQGLLLVGDYNFDQESMVRAVNSAIEIAPSWTPNHSASRGRDVVLAIPGLDLPYRALTLLLILFAIVIGPVNFIVVRRMKRPALLLVTIPAIAFVFSLGLFAYGALAQGLDVRAASYSRALLDQRLHRSTVGEERLVFAGLSPGPGLQPGPGTQVFANLGQNRYDDKRMFTLDFAAGSPLYAGDFLQVRTPTRQTHLVDRASRARLEFMPSGETFSVENGLGVEVERLIYMSKEGRTFRSSGVIPVGGKQTLVMHDSSSFDDLGQLATWAVPPAQALGGLVPGSYAAKLRASPFLDAEGIEYSEVASDHAVVGILPLDGAR